MAPSFRPPAIPLVTVDPYFSIWSTTDRLSDGKTRHWTLAPHELVGLIRIDGRVFRFLGSTTTGHEWRNARQPSGMRQVEADVRPTQTRYRFEDAGVALEVTFLTPLLPDDLDLLSRPFSYVHFELSSLDGEAHECELYLEAAANIACGDPDELMVWERDELASGWSDLRIGTWEQNQLGQRGDLTTIDWGYLHLMGDPGASASIASASSLRDAFANGSTGEVPDATWTRHGEPLRGAPVLALSWQLGRVGARAERTAVLGYEDGVSIDYFRTPRPAYCFRNGASFTEIAEHAIAEWAQVRERCDAFDTVLTDQARSAGGDRYADLVSLAYRQSVAAHKLVADEEGKAIFLSKECTSNGSIGTVDVSYPSTPLYLLFAPELVAGMLRPIFRFAGSSAWQPEYAPHDVGTYPRATGQTYGMRIETVNHDRQMPVEECGNMLIMTAAYVTRSGDTGLASENWALLEQWVDYLVEYGLDPANQLCTDDFAGHLARNTNLSIKAIMGIACFGKLCELTGRDGADRCHEIAADYAARWREMAADGDHYRLTFDGEGTWSLKYNLIWDQYFGFGLFPADVREKEIAHYLKQADTYGIPLDSRAPFTKTDWLVWAACLTSDRSTRDAFVEYAWKFASQTPDRTPFSDWYDTHDAREQSFHNRTVIGGIFMPMLMDRYAASGPPAGRGAGEGAGRDAAGDATERRGGDA